MAEPVTEGTEVPHDAGHSKVFPPLDPTTFSPQLVWLAITFVALYLALSRWVLPRISTVIEERRQRIARDLATAERLKSETEQALKTYEKSLADAHANASGIARANRDSLNGEIEKERHAVESQTAARVLEAERRIQQTKEKALSSVSDIATDTAQAVIKKLIGVDVAKGDIKRALQDVTK